MDESERPGNLSQTSKQTLGGSSRATGAGISARLCPGRLLAWRRGHAGRRGARIADAVYRRRRVFATGSPLSDGVVDETAVVSKTTAIALAGRALARAREAGLGTACILVEAEGVDAIAQHHGETEAEALRQLALTRLRNLLRRGDQVFRLTDDRFILLLAPSPRLDLETLLQLAARLQTSLEEPATIENATRFFSASVGFCGSARLRD